MLYGFFQKVADMTNELMRIVQIFKNVRYGRLLMVVRPCDYPFICTKIVQVNCDYSLLFRRKYKCCLSRMMFLFV